MHLSFDPPPTIRRILCEFTFIVSEMHWKSRVSFPPSKNQAQTTKYIIFFNVWSLHRIVFLPLKSGGILFSPRVKSPPNPRSANALCGEAVKKGTFPILLGNLNRVKIRWKPPVCPLYLLMGGGGRGSNDLCISPPSRWSRFEFLLFI